MGLQKPKDIEEMQDQFVGRLKDEVLLKQILDNQYLLVIGSEAVLKRDLYGTDGTGDSNILMYHAMIQDSRMELKEDTTRWTDSMWHDYFRRNRHALNKDLYIKVEEDYQHRKQYLMEDLSDELVQLLQTKQFPLVVTTTTDRYIETLMSYIWKDSLKIVYFYDNSTLDWFYTEIKKKKKDPFYQMPPILFYAFGRANHSDDGLSHTRFVFSENDAIETISRWMQIPKDKELFKFISQKKIMAIGCKFDDWRFRFFWYSLRQDVSNLSQGSVAITFNESDESENRLKRYLRNEKIHVETDSRQFMRHVVELLNPVRGSISAKEWENLLRNKRKSTGFIFISYAHEDFSIAYQVYQYLIKEGYDVWFDYKALYSDDKYEQSIRDALTNCCICIPILSKQVATDLREDKLERFYIAKEWRLIKERKALGLKVIPLATVGYDVHEDYHQIAFKRFWDIKSEREDMTIEYVDNIKHFKEGLDKI